MKKGREKERVEYLAANDARVTPESTAAASTGTFGSKVAGVEMEAGREKERGG